VVDLICGSRGPTCLLEPTPLALIGVMLTLVLLGAALGWLVRYITPYGACMAVKALVITAIIAIIVWQWMFEQGATLWFFQRLSMIPALLFFMLTWPFALGVAVSACVRDGREIFRSIWRVLFTFAAIPLVYLIVYQSGGWPSRLSEHAMTTTFFRSSAAFGRIGTALSARTDDECRTGCSVPTDSDAPVGRGFEQAEMFYYPYWTIGLYRDELEKGFVYAP
jgi:hypothetical protein